MLTRFSWLRDPSVSSLICSAEGGGEGGGGNDEGDDKALEAKIAGMVNSAITAHMKRAGFRNMIAETFKESLTAALPTLKEQLVAGDDQGGDKKADDANGDAVLKAKIRELELKAQQLEAERQQEKEAARRTRERAAINDALAKAGVQPERLDGAAALLFHELRRHKTAEDGSIVWTVPKDGYVDEVPLAEGIKAWLATDQGKAYLPPVGSGGSGATGARSNARGDKPPSRDEMLNQLGSLLMGPVE